MIPMQGGVVAAFGLVRGSAQADMLQLSAANPITQDLLAQVGFQNEGCNIICAGRVMLGGSGMMAACVDKIQYTSC